MKNLRGESDMNDCSRKCSVRHKKDVAEIEVQQERANRILVRAEKAEAENASLTVSLSRRTEERDSYLEAVRLAEKENAALAARVKSLEQIATDADTYRPLYEQVAERERVLQSRIDAAIVTALRYESLHDRDPKRGEHWGEHKMALMVDAPPALAQDKAAKEKPE